MFNSTFVVMCANKIKVGLVDDQLLFRSGMKSILNSYKDMEVIFEASNGYTVIDNLNTAQVTPDVMLVDLSLPPNGKVEFTGSHLTQSLIEHYPQIMILILSVHDDENFIAKLIEQGAHGYLVKDSDPQEVHDAIVSVHTKGSYINERTLKAIQHKMSQKIKTKKQLNDLTKREIEILQYTCQQFTADEIAEKLFISVKTVNGHRNNLLQKTGSRNVTGLVIYAIKNNIVSLV